MNNDEIINALQSERQAHFLNPSIVCGLGRYGRSINGRLRNRLASVPGLNYERLLHLVDFTYQRSGDDGFEILSKSSSRMVVTDPFETRTTLNQAIRDRSADIERHWQKITAGLLDNSGDVKEIESTEISIFFIGDCRELDGSVGGLDIPQLVKKSLNDHLVNLKSDLIGLFMLPEGACEKGAEVYAFLQDLNYCQNRKTADGADQGPLFDNCFLVSPINSNGILDQEGSMDMVVEFLFLSLTESKVAMNELFRNESGALATFGLSSLVYPAMEVTRFEATRFISRLISGEILREDDGLPGGGVSRFLKENRLNLTGMRTRMDAFEEGSITDQVRIDPLYFSQVKMRYWPDRVSSYDTYLENEKTRELLGCLENNLSQTYAEAKTIIKNKVNRMIISEPGIDKTRRFLLDMRKQVHELHARAVRTQDESLKTPPPLDRYKKALTQTIKNMPGPGALSGRLILLCTMLYFIAVNTIRLLKRIPKKYFDTDFLPPEHLVAVVFVALTAALGWMTYKRAESKIYRLRGEYLNEVEKKHRYIIDWWMGRNVTLLFGDSKSKRLSDRHITSLIGLINEEIAAIDRFKKKYMEILETLGKNPVGFPGSKIRRPIADAFGIKINIDYKRGHYQLDEEAANFLAAAGHSGWRNLKKEELEKRLTEYVLRGYRFAHVTGVQQVISELTAEGDSFEKVLSDLRSHSSPYLALVPSVPRPVEMLVLASPSNQSWLGGKHISAASFIGSADRNSIHYLQMAPVRVESIAALGLWRQAYESLGDKSKLRRRNVGKVGRRDFAETSEG